MARGAPKEQDQRAGPVQGEAAAPRPPRNSIERQIKRLQEMEAQPVDPDAAAAEHGYTERIPPQKAPFNTMGEPLYRNPKTGNYISPDRTGHGGGVWKGFDRDGNRVGTYDGDLNPIRK
jgi:hypothetical protein